MSRKKNVSETIKKEKEIVIEVQETNLPTVSSETDIIMVSSLEEHTKIILALEEDNKRNIFKIASQLELVKSKKLYEEGGYKSVTEYGERELNYKASTTSALVRISQRFLDLDGNIVKEELQNYSVYQLMELLKLTDTELNKALTDNKITSDISAKNIRNTVKEIKAEEHKNKFNPENKTDDSNEFSINQDSNNITPSEGKEYRYSEDGSEFNVSDNPIIKQEIKNHLQDLASALVNNKNINTENLNEYTEIIRQVMLAIDKIN